MLLLDQLAARENNVLPLLVDLDHFEIVIIPNVLLEILRRCNVNLRRRQKRLHADIDQQPAFDHGLDLAVDDATFVADGEDAFPVFLELGLLARENDHAFFIFELLDEHIDLIADLDRLDVIKLITIDDAFTFITDVHQHFFGTDFDDMTFDNFASSKASIALLHGFFHCEHNNIRTD